MSRTLSFAYLSDVPIKGVEEEKSKHWRRGRGLSIPWRRCNQTTNQSLKNNFIFLLFYSINKYTNSNSIGFSSLTFSSTRVSQCPDIPNIYIIENWKTFHAISHEHEPWPGGLIYKISSLTSPAYHMCICNYYNLLIIMIYEIKLIVSSFIYFRI